MVLLGDVGAAVLLVDSSVGTLASVVGADAVEVISVLKDVAVGDDEVDDEETSVEYVAAVVPKLGLLSC